MTSASGPNEHRYGNLLILPSTVSRRTAAKACCEQGGETEAEQASSGGIEPVAAEVLGDEHVRGFLLPAKPVASSRSFQLRFGHDALRDTDV